jgi:hypothetical protein
MTIIECLADTVGFVFCSALDVALTEFLSRFENTITGSRKNKQRTHAR